MKGKIYLTYRILAVNQNSRDNSPESKSSNSESIDSSKERKVDNFEDYLKGFMKKDKYKTNTEKKMKREKALVNYLQKKIPTFSPIRSSFSRHIATSKNLPKINTMRRDVVNKTRENN